MSEVLSSWLDSFFFFFRRYTRTLSIVVLFFLRLTLTSVYRSTARPKAMQNDTRGATQPHIPWPPALETEIGRWAIGPRAQTFASWSQADSKLTECTEVSAVYRFLKGRRDDQQRLLFFCFCFFNFKRLKRSFDFRAASALELQKVLESIVCTYIYSIYPAYQEALLICSSLLLRSAGGET